MVAETDVSAM